METLNKYVPKKKEAILVPIPGTSESEEVEKYIFHQILLGGDQLTKCQISSTDLCKCRN